MVPPDVTASALAQSCISAWDLRLQVKTVVNNCHPLNPNILTSN